MVIPEKLEDNISAAYTIYTQVYWTMWAMMTRVVYTCKKSSYFIFTKDEFLQIRFKILFNFQESKYFLFSSLDGCFYPNRSNRDYVKHTIKQMKLQRNEMFYKLYHLIGSYLSDPMYLFRYNYFEYSSLLS